MSLDNMTLDEVEFWSKGVKDAMAAIENRGLYRCPECKHLMVGKPCDWNICTSCKIEFGYDGGEYPNEIPLWSGEKP